MELHIQQGDGPQLERALKEIQDNHIDEPGVAEAMYRLLYASGLIQPAHAEGVPVGAAPAQPAPAPQASGDQGKIWTPDSGAPSRPAPGKGPSKSGASSSGKSDDNDDDGPVIWTP